MPSHLFTAAIAFMALAAGCSRDVATSPSGEPGSGHQPTPPKPTPASISFVPAKLLIAPGHRIALQAEMEMSDLSRVPVHPTWVSSDTGVVKVDAEGSAVAVAPGEVTITATLDGFRATGSLIVVTPTVAADSDALIVQGFSVIEFQYAAISNQYYYAPQIRATTGRASVLIGRVEVSIPGMYAPMAIECGGALSPGNPRDFNGGVYGDWTFTFGPLTGASGTHATATITYLDAAGATGKYIVSGPIVRGTTPPYGMTDTGLCFRGRGGG